MKIAVKRILCVGLVLLVRAADADALTADTLWYIDQKKQRTAPTSASTTSRPIAANVPWKPPNRHRQIRLVAVAHPHAPARLYLVLRNHTLIVKLKVSVKPF